MMEINFAPFSPTCYLVLMHWRAMTAILLLIVLRKFQLDFADATDACDTFYVG